MERKGAYFYTAVVCSELLIWGYFVINLLLSSKDCQTKWD